MSKRKKRRRRPKERTKEPDQVEVPMWREDGAAPVVDLVGLLPDDLMDRFYVIDYDGQQVTYRHFDDDTGQGTVVTCSALDFISRVVQEIVAARPEGTEGK